MAVDKRIVGHANPINPIKDTEFIFYICLILIKSNADLKSHLEAMDTKTRWKPSQMR